MQDAVAAANILAGPLRAGVVTDGNLAAVQARRAFPMRVIQWVQVVVQNKLLSPAQELLAKMPGATPNPFA